MKKYTGSTQHGVYISATTKREFFKNKDFYKSEGIKSPYSLQIEKDTSARIARAQAMTERKAIAEAYKLETKRFEEVNLTEKELQQINKAIRNYNREIDKAIKQGKITRDTPKMSFPINRKTGKINLDRLAKEVKKLGKPIKSIVDSQRNMFYNNVYEVYGQSIYELTKEMLKDVPNQLIYDEFEFDDFLSVIVRYDMRDFSDDAIERFWRPLERYQDHFIDIVKELGGVTLWLQSLAMWQILKQ